MNVREPNKDPNAEKLIVAFDALLFLAVLLCMAVLAPPLLSTKIKRKKTWFGMMVSGILYGISYLMLMFIGKQDIPEPSSAVCLFQACLVHSTPILAVSSALGFVLELFIAFFLNYQGKPPSRDTPWIILASSFLVFLFVLLEALVIGVRNPDDVRRNDSYLYCHITTSIPNIILCAHGIVLSLAMMIIEVFVVIIIWKTKVKLRRQPNSADIEIPTHLLLRAFSFSIFVCLTVGVTVYTLVIPPKGGTSSSWYLLLGIVPLSGVATFETQKDILRFYYWRNDI
ncbi:hypothetical protein DFS33DRAFT_1101328 [Desarmillaria ectypa]|nr:hypothetical protein DFS33DRAFT_1101328 [Desarmillaria ectypa]